MAAAAMPASSTTAPSRPTTPAENGGTLTVQGTWSSNAGLSVSDASTLTLRGTWDAVPLSATGGGTINVGGTCTNDPVTFTATGDSIINISALVENAGETL